MGLEEKNITTCIIDGEEKEYGFCSENINAYDKYPVFDKLKYIGTGNIYRIKGKINIFKQTYHFWIKTYSHDI